MGYVRHIRRDGGLNKMPEEQKIDNNSKVKIANIEKILPKIEQNLAGREKEQAECASIKLRIPALKKEFIDAEKKYIELRNEISQTNKEAVNLYLQTEPSPFVRFYKRIQQIWRVSKTHFFIMLILLATLAVYTLATFYYRNNQMQTLSIEIGFTLIGFVLFIRLPKYRYFTGAFLLAMLIIISISFVDDGALKWTFISTAIAIIGVGLAIQTFSSGEVVEQKLGKIEIVEKKLNEVLERIPESPATENHQPQLTDVVQKPEEKK